MTARRPDRPPYDPDPDVPPDPTPPVAAAARPPAPEIGGRDGPEPTRFGDWEKKGRCIDF